MQLLVASGQWLVLYLLNHGCLQIYKSRQGFLTTFSAYVWEFDWPLVTGHCPTYISGIL